MKNCEWSKPLYGRWSATPAEVQERASKFKVVGDWLEQDPHSYHTAQRLGIRKDIIADLGMSYRNFARQ